MAVNSLNGFNKENHAEFIRRIGVIILDKLQNNVNKDGLYEPFTSKHIENSIGINGVTVREVVAHLRKNLWPICSGHKGYWYANTIDELEETSKHIRGRAMSMLEVNKHLTQCLSEWREKVEAEQVGKRRMVQSELCGV